MTTSRRRLLAATGSLLAFGAARPLFAKEAFATVLSDAEWRERLGPDRYAVLRQSVTEPPYSSPLLKERRDGLFACAGCARPLFPSKAKYESYTGWPSFKRPLPGAVGEKPDRSLGMDRTAVHCRGCGGHLGHVFSDGPRPDFRRYCINGLALSFVAKGA